MKCSNPRTPYAKTDLRINTMNSLICIKEIQPKIWNPPKKNKRQNIPPGANYPTGEIKKETAPSLYRLFQRIKNRENKQQLSYEAIIIFRLKADNEVVRKKTTGESLSKTQM